MVLFNFQNLWGGGKDLHTALRRGKGFREHGRQRGGRRETGRGRRETGGGRQGREKGERERAGKFL